MSKESIKVTIKNSENNSSFKTNAIIQDNIIKYKEDNNTVVKFNYDTNELTRENSELRMNYLFSNENPTTGTIFIKDLNKELELEIKTKKIQRKNNDIEIEFLVEENDFLYKIEVIKWVF